MSLPEPTSSTLSLPARPPVQPEAGRPDGHGRTDAGCTVDSTDLLRGQKAVDIVHNGATYRLQATRLGKLILTK